MFFFRILANIVPKNKKWQQKTKKFAAILCPMQESNPPKNLF